MSDLITDPSSPFYGAEVISTYTRAQAIADGTLVDVSELASEAGYNIPVAMTRESWSDLVEWTDADERRKSDYTGNDPVGRLWDVLSVMRGAARAALRDAADSGSARYGTKVYRIKREGRGTMPRLTPFHVHVGGDDSGAPCITIMLPHES